MSGSETTGWIAGWNGSPSQMSGRRTDWASLKKISGMVETFAFWTGWNVPPVRVDNHMLARVLETSDEWIRERSGIVTRYYVEPGTGSADLGAQAARAALGDAGVTVPLTLLDSTQGFREVTVTSGDRYDYLKLDPSY